jgi:molybdopterin/thiamine biosynthesis adenylyltransferase
MEPPFDYATMVSRNLGFVSAEEQARIRSTPVFVCGVGGMGGACVQTLVRAGAERLGLAEFDRFDVSNLNRQVFAFVSGVGREKLASTLERLRDMNPGLRPETWDARWVDELDSILATYKIVVNAMDDLAAGLVLYRKAREHGATVIDAYTSPLPSVTRVAPGDPRPEERLGFGTLGLDPRRLPADVVDRCKAREMEYVMLNSSSVRYVDLGVAGEVVAGRRSRPSFAPMVITTGNLMAYEVLSLMLGRASGTDHRGYFLDPWRGRIERPRPAFVAWLLGFWVRREMRRLLGGS